jgi:hypothetical protein
MWCDCGRHEPELALGRGFVNPATLLTAREREAAIYSVAANAVLSVVAQGPTAGLYSGPAGSTPDVGGVVVYVATDPAPVTISGLSGGLPLQRVWLVLNGNQTLANNADQRTLTGFPVTPSANSCVLLELEQGVWRQKH